MQNQGCRTKDAEPGMQNQECRGKVDLWPNHRWNSSRASVADRAGDPLFYRHCPHDDRPCNPVADEQIKIPEQKQSLSSNKSNLSPRTKAISLLEQKQSLSSNKSNLSPRTKATSLAEKRLYPKSQEPPRTTINTKIGDDRILPGPSTLADFASSFELSKPRAKPCFNTECYRFEHSLPH